MSWIYEVNGKAFKAIVCAGAKIRKNGIIIGTREKEDEHSLFISVDGPYKVINMTARLDCDILNEERDDYIPQWKLNKGVCLSEDTIKAISCTPDVDKVRIDVYDQYEYVPQRELNKGVCITGYNLSNTAIDLNKAEYTINDRLETVTKKPLAFRLLTFNTPIKFKEDTMKFKKDMIAFDKLGFEGFVIITRSDRVIIKGMNEDDPIIMSFSIERYGHDECGRIGIAYYSTTFVLDIMNAIRKFQTMYRVKDKKFKCVFSPKMPLLLEYDVCEGIDIRFYVAPRIETE